MDITRTVLDALGLEPPDGVQGLNLQRVAGGWNSVAIKPLIATLGPRYTARLGNWLMFGEVGKQPILCELDVDPACAVNRFADRPWTARISWQWTRTELARVAQLGAQIEREPANIDADTAAALTVWGDIDQ
jgi:hypothetical protein